MTAAPTGRPAVRRARLLAVSLAGVTAANLAAPHLPDPGAAGQVAWLAVVSFPLATLTPRALAVAPWARRRLIAGAVLAALVAALLIWGGLSGTPATLAKLIGATLVGLLLESLLSSPAELIGIALLVAAVDAYSVAAGPTRAIVEHHPSVLSAFTLGFVPAGSTGSGQIGASDFAFFAMFLGASERMRFHADATWLWLTASFGATMALSYRFDLALPALPLLSLAFLAVNARPLMARVWRGSPDRES